MLQSPYAASPLTPRAIGESVRISWATVTRAPFMVERGHFDGVAPDESVAWEFAKVNFLYAADRLEDQHLQDHLRNLPAAPARA